MRTARALACTLVLGLLLPGAARAQAARTPAVGGGSFNTAPLLAPGRYRDTILPDEFLYYGVALKVGQRLRVRARIASTDWQAWNDSVFGFAINLSTPLRQVLTDPVAQDVIGNSNAEFGAVSEDNMASRLRWDFFGPPAVPLAEAVEQAPYEGAGTWYVSFNAFTRGQKQVAEFPLEFELSVDGTAQTEPPDTTPAPTATPASGRDQPATADDAGGPGAGALLGLGALGLGVGLVAGGLLGRRRPA